MAASVTRALVDYTVSNKPKTSFACAPGSFNFPTVPVACDLRRAEGAPRLRYRRPADRRSMAQKWRDAVTELLDLQDGYRAWLDSLPDNLAESATAEALRAICDLDLSDLDSVEPPRGFGRD